MKDKDNIPQFLQKLRSHQPWKVPDGYFDELPDQIMSRIHREIVEAPRSNTLRLPGKTLVAIAASLTLTLGLFFWWSVNQSSREDVVLAESEVVDYVMQNLHEFDEELFYSNHEVDDWVEDAISSPEELEELWKGVIDEVDESLLQDIF